ncbi:hypothetical protein B1H58_06450 [Pantoea alhagi]|uniref:Uncharacterized protein n=1 Tax=Pantoea alhagi TaxID=1891675 RepID=A0A1W6B3M2_9GAMM|nr:hypothetical protein [Pantoea alhagi]ARJ41695.1 hypothetical protein B1H58_06450 [Pantoea alhagi]
MTSYGTKLANAHQPFVGKSSFNLPERLAKNEQQLIRCAAILSEGDKKSLTPAGAKQTPVLSGAFVAELSRRLNGQSNLLALTG